MRTALVAAAAVLALSAGIASAAPRYHNDHGYGHGKPGYGKVTAFERLAIARGKVKVAYLQRKARADGRVTPYERAQIRQAQADLNRTIARARRT